MYQAWDEMGGPVSDNFNDLEPAALRVEPRLAKWRDRLAEATGERPQLAGSGSTWFVRGRVPRARAAWSCGWHGTRCQPEPTMRHGCWLARRGAPGDTGYLPARLCQRVAFNIFLCFFLRMRFRRFLINDPMAGCKLSRSER